MDQEGVTNSVDKKKLKKTGPGLYYRLEGICNFHFGSEQMLRLVEIPLRVALDETTSSDPSTVGLGTGMSHPDVTTMTSSSTEALNRSSEKQVNS